MDKLNNIIEDCFSEGKLSSSFKLFLSEYVEETAPAAISRALIQWIEEHQPQDPIEDTPMEAVANGYSWKEGSSVKENLIDFINHTNKLHNQIQKEQQEQKERFQELCSYIKNEFHKVSGANPIKKIAKKAFYTVAGHYQVPSSQMIDIINRGKDQDCLDLISYVIGKKELEKATYFKDIPKPAQKAIKEIIRKYSI